MPTKDSVMSKTWQVFKASDEKFTEAARSQLEREGYTEWSSSVNHRDVPAFIWEQYLLENLAGRREVRLLGYKNQPRPNVNNKEQKTNAK